MDRLARLHPVELARLLELPPAGPLHVAWSEGQIPLPAGLQKSPAAEVWQAWLNGHDSELRSALARIEPNRSCSIQVWKAGSTPGAWLPEACYGELSEHWSAKKVLTPNERIKLAESEFRLGHYATARLEARRLLESNPKNPWAVFWLSHSDAELAQDCFSKVTSLNPDSARVHEMLAHYYTSRREFPRAKTEYQAAIQLAPRLADLHLGLGTLYLRDGELAEAEREFKSTLQLAPGSPLTFYLLGDLYVQQQHWEPAIDYLRRALGDATLEPKVRLDLARAHAETGQTRQALADLLPALKEDKDGDVHYRLASLYRQLGETAKAEEAIIAFKRLRDAALQANRWDLETLEKERERVDRPNPSQRPEN